MAQKRIEAIKHLPILEINAEAEALTNHLLAKVLPPNAAEDAFHIAVAASHGMDFLLTWNCKHINNPHCIRRIEQCCTDFGMRCPVVATPTELLSTEL
jgi:hypothetical protein